MAMVSFTRKNGTILQNHGNWYVSPFCSLNKYQFFLLVLRVFHLPMPGLCKHSKWQHMESIIGDISVSSTKTMALWLPSLHYMQQLQYVAGYDCHYLP